jgi:hypothetical protein
MAPQVAQVANSCQASGARSTAADQPDDHGDDIKSHKTPDSRHSPEMAETPDVKDVFVHPSAVVDAPCSIGAGTKIWHFSHIQQNAHIGKHCNPVSEVRQIVIEEYT